jgi:hypothetical protein
VGVLRARVCVPASSGPIEVGLQRKEVARGWVRKRSVGIDNRVAAGHASQCIRLVDEVEHGGEGVRPKRAHGNEPAHARKSEGGWGGRGGPATTLVAKLHTTCVAHAHPHTLTRTSRHAPTHPHTHTPTTHTHTSRHHALNLYGWHSREVLQVQIVDELGDEVQEGEALKQEDGLDHAQVVEDGAREGNHQGPKPARRMTTKGEGAACHLPMI